MINIAMAGAAGRMGRTILSLAARQAGFRIAGGLEHPKSPVLGQDLGVVLGQKPLGVRITARPDEALQKADVLIDFTHPSALAENLKAVLKNKTAYVVGTTGLSVSQIASLRAAGKKIAVVQSPNMSIGVNLLFRLAEMTAKALDETYDIEVAEIHHRMKKDAPSGTAMKLLEILAGARKKNLAKDVVYGREGEVGARPKGQIGVFALRGGDVVGDHTVSFLGDGERVELSHYATSRDAFAQGALHAAKFAAGRKNGFYSMLDVLGLGSGV